MANQHPGHDEAEETVQDPSWRPDPGDDEEESDADLEAWLRQREVDLEEQRFALADLNAEGW